MMYSVHLVDLFDHNMAVTRFDDNTTSHDQTNVYVCKKNKTIHVQFRSSNPKNVYFCDND